MNLSGEFDVEIILDVGAVVQGSCDGGTVTHETRKPVWLLVAIPWDISELELVQIGVGSHLTSAG